MRPRTVDEITAEWSSAVQLHLEGDSGQVTKNGMKPLEWGIFKRILNALVPNVDEMDGLTVVALENYRAKQLVDARSDLVSIMFLDDSQDVRETDVWAAFYRLRALARAFVPEVVRILPIVIAQRMVSEELEDDEYSGRPSTAHTPMVPSFEMDPRAVSSDYPTMQAPYNEDALERFRDSKLSLEQMTREHLLAPSSLAEQTSDMHPSFHPAIPPPAGELADDGPLVTVDFSYSLDPVLDEDTDKPDSKKT